MVQSLPLLVPEGIEVCITSPAAGNTDRKDSAVTSEQPPPTQPPGWQPTNASEHHRGKPRWYRRGWVIALVSLLIGFGIGSSSKTGDATDKSATPAAHSTPATVTVTGTEQTVAPTTVTVTTTTTPPATTKTVKMVAKPKTAFGGDGTYLVGTDIKAGTYRGSGSGQCYWARLSGLSGGFNDIIANGNSAGQVVVTISRSDKGFTTQACGSWSRVQ